MRSFSTAMILLSFCIPALGQETVKTFIFKKTKQEAQPKKEPPKNFTNSIGMKFVWIPPSTFMMGSPKEEKERRDDETQHKVTLTKGFYMGMHTVTQEQWKEFMPDNHSSFKGEKNLPIDNETWEDCQEFIKKLREKDKKPYRLPTGGMGICLPCRNNDAV